MGGGNTADVSKPVTQALKGRDILLETAPKGRSIEAQCAALGYLRQRPTTFQAGK